MLGFSYFVFIFICLIPTLVGLIGIFVSSFSYIPPLGFEHFSLSAFYQVFQWQGVESSILLSLSSALISTYLACFISFCILQISWKQPYWLKIERALSALVAMPHVAFAIGIAFLFAPTGIGIRILDVFPFEASGASNATLPLLVKNEYGLGLIFVLALKEVPFLLLMSVGILQQIKVAQIEKTSASLGYNHSQTWLKCIFPLWLAKIRFPLFAVVAYGVSVVELGLIIGPSNPPTFAVLLWQWFNEPDLNFLPRAAAGGVILCLLSLCLIACVRFFEWLVTTGFKSWQYSGPCNLNWFFMGKAWFRLIAILFVLILPILFLWSVAKRWPFPSLLPTHYSFNFWQSQWDGIQAHIQISVNIALIAASIALVLAVIAHEYKMRRRLHIPIYLILIPIIAPQLSLLFGIQISSLYTGLDEYFVWVCWAHVFFTFPYVYLSLEGPWQSYDQKLTQVALSLGKSPFFVWWYIKLPMLFSALMAAWAIGISVSLAQYLPTVLLGGGQISTLTTEAVALMSGFDRRISAIYALCQALLPFVFFALVFFITKLVRKNKKIGLS